jgi:hypothetical protein
LISQASISFNCRCSWALRMIGLAIDPQRRSATIVVARSRCRLLSVREPGENISIE